MLKLPPSRDPELEAKFAGRHSLRDVAGTFVVGIVAVLLVLGVVALIVSLMS